MGTLKARCTSLCCDLLLLNMASYILPDTSSSGMGQNLQTDVWMSHRSTKSFVVVGAVCGKALVKSRESKEGKHFPLHNLVEVITVVDGDTHIRPSAVCADPVHG